MGDAQIEVALEKIKRKFGADLRVKMPKVPYRETITKITKSEYRHKKQSGGHGQFGHVVIRLEPQDRDQGFLFSTEITGGKIPKEYIPSVEKGVTKALDEGSLAGFPLVDLKAVLYDGSFHDVDSSGMSFEIASVQALKQGVGDADPVLLEPVVKLSVTVPDAYTGEVISDLNGKRGRILGMNPENGVTVIEAVAPLAEVQRYSQGLALGKPGPGRLYAGVRPLRTDSSKPGAQGDRRSQTGEGTRGFLDSSVFTVIRNGKHESSRILPGWCR